MRMKLFLLALLVSAVSYGQDFSTTVYQQLGTKKTHVKVLGALSSDSLFRPPLVALANPWEGSLYYNTSDKNLYRYNGTSWVITGSSTSASALTTGTLPDARLSANVLLTSSSIAQSQVTNLVTDLGAKAPNVLTGYVSGAGVVVASDNLLQAIQKITGNIALKADNLLTGYVSGAGTVAAGDNILQAIQKLNGNIGLRGLIAGQTWTGTHIFPSTVTIGNVSAAELLTLDNATSEIQGQLNTKASLTGAETLTNKRITARVVSITSNATPTINADVTDIYKITALATAATIAAPTGTYTDGQIIEIHIKDDGSARALTWNAIFRGSTDVVLPSTTVAGKKMKATFEYDLADLKFDMLGLTNGF